MDSARLVNALQHVLAQPHYAHIRDLARNLATDLAPLIQPEHAPNEAGLRCFVYEFSGYYVGGHAVIVARDRTASDAIFAERSENRSEFLVLRRHAQHAVLREEQEARDAVAQDRPEGGCVKDDIRPTGSVEIRCPLCGWDYWRAVSTVEEASTLRRDAPPCPDCVAPVHPHRFTDGMGEHAPAQPRHAAEGDTVSESKSSASGGGGIGFFGLLTIVFITLKLTGYIDWSWWWVWSPMLISGAIFIVIMAAALVFFAIAESTK